MSIDLLPIRYSWLLNAAAAADTAWLWTIFYFVQCLHLTNPIRYGMNFNLAKTKTNSQITTTNNHHFS